MYSFTRNTNISQIRCILERFTHQILKLVFQGKQSNAQTSHLQHTKAFVYKIYGPTPWKTGGQK